MLRGHQSFRDSAFCDRQSANIALIRRPKDLGWVFNTTRSALDAHNTLVSNIHESRRNLTQLEKALSEMSGRMLMGIAAKYGKTSLQYIKAGGSIRKDSRASSIVADAVTMQTMPPAEITDEAIMANGRAR